MEHRIDPKEARSQHDPEYLLSLTLDIAEEMLMSGAEINRVEDTLLRICKAYEFKKVNVFSITEFIFVSLLAPNGKIITQTRRVYSYNNNLSHLEQLNKLSRYICTEKPGVSAILDRIELLSQEEPVTPAWVRCLCFMIGGGAFACFFGGNFLDCIASSLVAIFMYFFGQFSKMQEMNRIAHTVVCSAIAGTLGLFLYTIGIGSNLDKIMIGNIMLLIPGMVFTNSIRDMLCGNIISGLLRLIESLLVAIAIAVGFSIPLLLIGGSF
ncbi:MAG: threonine/serine exporter family protein [Lachnospiraceae bacterium]